MMKRGPNNKILFKKDFLVKKIKEILEPVEYVIFAYLFGSYATGNEWAESDIDIAVYVNQKKIKDFFDVKINLLTLLTDALKTDDVDLLILNEATPVLKYEVLTKGVLLFTKDENVHTEFYLRGFKEFFDYRYLLEKNYKAAMAALKENIK